MEHVARDVELRIAGTGPGRGAAARAGGGRPADLVLRARRRTRSSAALYAGARAVAFVPYEEDYGLVTLEAMLAGKPVITCTDSGGTAELVSDGVTGLVVEPTPEALAAAIDRLWSSRREARRMGAAARERAPR